MATVPILSDDICSRLVGLASARPGEEVCGLIGIDAQEQLSIYPITNIAPARHGRFAMAPKELIGAFRSMRDRSQMLHAIYHSHPFAPPVPSTIDVREAAYPDAIYIIISVGYDPPVRAYRIRRNCVIPLTRLHTLPEPDCNEHLSTQLEVV